MMKVLLDDLLDLARIDAGRMRVERVDLDLRELVSDTAALWSAQAERRGLYLKLEGAQSLPQAAAGDPMRLRQVLNNLISNAIKFTDAGGVTIEAVAVRLTEGEQHGDEPADWMVRLTVSDTGPGLDAGQIERLFAPFDQGHDSTARTHGGTGLGLSISRELARLRGGDLFAASPAGGGAAFTLEVALAEPRGTAEPPVRDIRVLVADDHEMGRRAVGLMLEPYGVQLTAAASAEAALDMLATQPFDVVLMDVSMPQMGGREACRRLRAAPGPNQATPVIACTASTGPQDWEACRRVGMNGLVAKPFDAAALHGAIRAALLAGNGRKVRAA
jgi:CheY-like chemotaxis protein